MSVRFGVGAHLQIPLNFPKILRSYPLREVRLMTLRLLTFAALGSLFITLNIASTGCIGGASLSPSQLSGGADLSAANPDGSNKDKDKSGSDENAGSTTPPPGGGDGSSGSSTTGGDGGGSGGDVAKGTANF